MLGSRIFPVVCSAIASNTCIGDRGGQGIKRDQYGRDLLDRRLIRAMLLAIFSYLPLDVTESTALGIEIQLLQQNNSIETSQKFLRPGCRRRTELTDLEQNDGPFGQSTLKSSHASEKRVKMLAVFSDALEVMIDGCSPDRWIRLYFLRWPSTMSYYLPKRTLIMLPRVLVTSYKLLKKVMAPQ
ncbi:unnamed protein product [Nesidiocoris tenuis]|uniref:Uncharacterized protein n=1 Tax=Nesidiocoris tenuis TaxID=355587 RepID=A0A6H5GTL1_9HEMI|nr:unnamed protein product [Nesidiocoris tenuis]